MVCLAEGVGVEVGNGVMAYRACNVHDVTAYRAYIVHDVTAYRAYIVHGVAAYCVILSLALRPTVFIMSMA